MLASALYVKCWWLVILFFFQKLKFSKVRIKYGVRKIFILKYGPYPYSTGRTTVLYGVRLFPTQDPHIWHSTFGAIYPLNGPYDIQIRNINCGIFCGLLRLNVNWLTYTIMRQYIKPTNRFFPWLNHIHSVLVLILFWQFEQTHWTGIISKSIDIGSKGFFRVFSIII